MFPNKLFVKSGVFNRTQTISFLVLIFMFAWQAVIGQTQPNIILILADDFGYENLGCNGGQSYQTPNLDAMAEQGLRFTQVHSCPNCSPSRFELMTGVYNFRNYTKWGVLPTSSKTFGNVLHDAGYKTAIFGKWQLDGGDNAVHTFGFDDYIIYDPLRTTTDNEDSVEDGSRYKDPHLYANGDYLPAAQMNGKFGDDVLVDSLRSFVTKNKNNKFFAYYSMISPHLPFTPTPDDPAFSTWDPNLPGDTSMYPSMVKYLDKKVGQILKFVDSLGISDKTIILFTGDNGTSSKIFSRFNGLKVKGGKGSTIEYGTHVPLLVKWQGHTPIGVDTSLIDFTDFYPTLADIGKASHDSLDGVSFYPQITGNKGTLRTSIFCHFQKNPANKTPLYRWAQDRRFKLYDSTFSTDAYLFYDILHDIKETKPIADSSLTRQKAITKDELLAVINNNVIHYVPTLSNPTILAITSSSVTIKDSILENGGAKITACGVVWDTLPDPQLSSGNHTIDNTSIGSFIDYITGLKPNTTYYLKAYATNSSGTAYSNQVIFKTSGAPVATAASAIDSDKFTANWGEYIAGSTYRLDVSTSPTFSQIINRTLNERFNNGITPPAGWVISNNIIPNTTSFGVASPSLELIASNAQVVTEQLSGPATDLTFWIKGLNTDQASALLVEGFDGSNWTAITNITGFPKNGAKKTFNINSIPAMAQNFIRFRFTYFQSKGTIALDDITIKYNGQSPLFVTGYNNVAAKTNSKLVTGLTAATTYYYRVRAVVEGTTTDNSNVIAVTTSNAASIASNEKQNSQIKTAAGESGLIVRIFPNPSSTDFTLAVQSPGNAKSELVVMDMYGKKVYHTYLSNNDKYSFGKTLASGEYIVHLVSGKLSKTIKLIKTGK